VNEHEKMRNRLAVILVLTSSIAVAGTAKISGTVVDEHGVPAKHSQVVLYRRVDDNWTSAQLINVKKMEADRNLREDPFLHPGDMLFVPKNALSKIKPFIPSSGIGAYFPLM